MCRLLITNHNDFALYDGKYGMLNLFNALEKMCGGNGNGFVLLHHNKIVHFEKGVELKNETIYNKCKSSKWDYLIWHTRVKSVGNVQDSNCHPFVNRKTNDCMCMNGTEFSLKSVANAFGHTDTEVVFRASVGSTAEEITEGLLGMSSVYLGAANGIPYAVNAGGSLERWDEGTKSLHASCFGKGIPNVNVTDTGYIWLNGKIDVSNVKPKAKTYYYGSAYGGGYGSNYGGYNHGYGYDYDDYFEYTQPKSTPKTVCCSSSAKPIATLKPSTAEANTGQNVLFKDKSTTSTTTTTSKPVKTVAKTIGSLKTIDTKKDREEKLNGFCKAYMEGYENGTNTGWLEALPANNPNEFNYFDADDIRSFEDYEYQLGIADGFMAAYGTAVDNIRKLLGVKIYTQNEALLNETAKIKNRLSTKDM